MDLDRDGYEYQLTILNIKMKVKFPCRMKIQHLGSLLTGQTPPSQDNRYIFNQPVTLKDNESKECFELTVSLLTDKGAKYIAGIIKLYQSQMVRSEGEKIVLSLSKCIDTEAFCEIKIDKVVAKITSKNAPYDRKSTLQRDVPNRTKDMFETQFSPHRSAYKVRVQESKSEYQFPLQQPKNVRPLVQQDWQTKSKSRYIPQTVYQKSRVSPRPNYVNVQQSMPVGFEMQAGSVNRQKMLEAEVYKEGYQKLKQKYRKETQLSKQELNKRLALQNSENNLKLEIMRLKLRNDEFEKTLSEKTSKLKEQQIQLSSLQQKQSDIIFLRQQNNKKQNAIRMLDDKVQSLTQNIEDLKELSDERSANDANKLKDMQMEMNNLKGQFETRERELENESKRRQEMIHQKQLELVSKRDSLQREKRNVSDLEKALQSKQYEMDKMLNNQKNNSKTKMQQLKSKMDHLQRQMLKLQQQKKDLTKDIEQYKGTLIKMDYQKKLSNQELQSLRIQFNQMKAYKQKFTELTRQNRTLLQERSHIQRQLERTIQNKESNLSEINKQFQDQIQYYKRVNRELDEKVKNSSNKLIEVEGQLDISRSQQDKIRRNLEASVKEAVDAKDKEKSSRKALKNKEQEMLSMETELATMKQKLKNVDQIYKLQGDKHREEVDKIRIQLDNELDKNQQLQESNNQLTMELNKLKIKLQYSEDRAQKETLNLKDKQNQVEGLIKDYEEQISGLDQSINVLRGSQKELVVKVQKLEMEVIKSEQKGQRTKKDLKVAQEKCRNLEQNLSDKVNDFQLLQKEREHLASKCQDLEHKLNQLQTEHASLNSDRSKVSKMQEMTQQEVKKLKGDITSLTSTVAVKEKQLDELRNVLKSEKDQAVKVELKYVNFKKEVDRNKQTLFDVIQKSLYTLPLGSKDDSSRNMDLLLKKPAQNTFSEYFAMITGHSKDVKQTLIKQMDSIKQLQREKERLQEEVASSSNKYQNTEMVLKRQIEQLQQQLQHVIEEKQLQLSEHSHTLDEMDGRIKEFEAVVEELNSQIEELNFTNSSMKMDYDVLNEQNQKKIANLKKMVSELQEKVDYQVMVISQSDQQCAVLEHNAQLLQTTIENESEAGLRKDKMIQELKDLNEAKESMIEELKRNKKQLVEKVSELQLYLQTEKDLNEKNKQLLSEEETKANELKNFISSMMKQKEAAIKSDLERSEAILTLQASLHEVSKDLQLVTDQNSRNIKTLESHKETIKKLQSTIKDSESEKKEQKAKYNKLLETVRDKDRELLNKDEVIKKLEVKYDKTVQKLKIEVRELQEELQGKVSANIEQSRDSNDKVFQLETQLQKKNSSIVVLEEKIVEMEEQLFSQREKTIHLQDSLSKMKGQNDELKLKINQMDSNLNQISDETKLKEEQLFDFSGKNYSLEMKLENKQREHLQEMEYLNNEWQEKYESMCEEYEQRLQLIEKERDYFKSLGEEKDREIGKLNQNIRNIENNESNTRKIYEQKLRKAEQEKISMLSIKNTEVQRTIQDAKSQGEMLKSKEVQLRRLTNQLQVARKTISNLDSKYNDYDQKLKGVNKLYQNEMEQLKKRDIVLKSYKQSVTNYLWNTEREIKKGVQNFIKQFLDVSEDKNSQKVVELARNLQKSIVEVLASKPIDK